jgi:hypothetical protein
VIKRICSMRSEMGFIRALVILGVLAVSATGAGSEQGGHGALHFACGAPTGVDPARVANICAEFLAILNTQPGTKVIESSDPGVVAAPGLEIQVTRASDTQIEIVPSWIDRNGRRNTLPSSGFVITDTTMTETMRRDLFLQVLANRPD